ncbi:sugar phosphate isomerase/epimerase family protein [Caballeronia cordobensis]|uniref:sugar phosphate isomerase/epimerase family protein n=1 Tax=Caballeronia cordobensis TaxID=1353886 RepID=UPI00045F0BFA|nr:xylose isomerase domain protein TIM barrel [Burkholderia sp. RPE67]
MRIAISNIAWEVSEDDTIAALLTRHGVDAIDIAPGKYFPQPSAATSEDMARVKGWWNERGIKITGMQSLLFGTTGLNLFGSRASREAMLAQLEAVCRIGEGVGATRLVFGSPKNRDRGELADDEALEIAMPFFRRLGDIASRHGVFVCLEPNPPCYGANFMTTSEETLSVVKEVAHPAIKMQLDAGAMTINAEDPVATLRACAPFIGHIHASEPGLVPIGDGACDHAAIARSVREALPRHVVTIEMVATNDEPHHASIERALRKTLSFYGDAGAGAAK